MNKLILLATTIGFLTTGAQAQETKAKRWRAHFGIGLPTAASGKSFVGSTAQSGGISYDLGHVGNGTWGLYGDGIMRGRERDNAAGGGTTMTRQGANSFGVQYRAHMASNTALYYGAGFGGYSLTTSSAVKTGDTTVTTTTEKGVFGGRVFVGQDFGKRYFGELGYTFVGKATLGTSKVNTSHTQLGIGLRF
ncbi:hypothetical protein [Armatimonas sp.]|uniref:hypothetical protein n=1 Tax=Armatimonas sp. TaxID=1872638 RepID=UPI0037523344